MRISTKALSVLLLTLVSACGDASPAAQPSVTPTSAAPAQARSLQRFTSDASGFDTSSYWLDTGREVVVFDAQFTDKLANELIAKIRATTKSPITYVVITHPNPDKFNGASAFQAIGAKVVASEATARAIPGVHAYKKYYFVEMAKMFTDATYPREAKVDVTFSGDLDLPLAGGTKVRLHELAHRGVSSTQTVAIIPDLHALVVGDLVHHEAHAWLEGGIVDKKPVPDLASWKEALSELRSVKGATVYGGRGTPAPVDVAVAEEQAYLTRMQALVERYVADLGPARSELAGPRASEHHKKIAALAAKEFPDYAFPYLIEYGVYGLVNQTAAR